MSDYPSIRPEDVRAGDTVLAKFDDAEYPATIEGVAHPSMRNDDDRLYVGGYVISGATDLRLVSMGRCCTPPEPPLTLGGGRRALYRVIDGGIPDRTIETTVNVDIDQFGRIVGLEFLTWPLVPTPPEPLCPFSMGETVYVKGAPKPLTVAGWNYYPAWDKWLVRCEDGTQGDDGELAYSLHPPLELTSAPPEPPLRVCPTCGKCQECGA